MPGKRLISIAAGLSIALTAFGCAHLSSTLPSEKTDFTNSCTILSTQQIAGATGFQVTGSVRNPRSVTLSTDEPATESPEKDCSVGVQQVTSNSMSAGTVDMGFLTPQEYQAAKSSPPSYAGGVGPATSDSIQPLSGVGTEAFINTSTGKMESNTIYITKGSHAIFIRFPDFIDNKSGVQTKLAKEAADRLP